MSSLSWRPSPAWLRELQDELGQLLRTPLDRQTGSLRAPIEQYAGELVARTKPGATIGRDERLAVYHRQYWFRLFSLLQGAFPLTARLIGFWQLNRFAASYLHEQPPRGWDIEDVVAGFAPFCEQALPPETLEITPECRLPTRAVRESLAIDAAYHRVFRAPDVPAYRPSAADAEHLLGGQLRAGPASAIVTESWPLCELRQRALRLTGEQLLPLEPALQTPRSWLLLRDQLKLVLIALEPREAELLIALDRQPVGAALAALEARCSEGERATLPAQAQAWLARSVRLGLWTGLERQRYTEPR